MKYYVNVYLHDRAYGGPEEGGWWYDTHETHQIIPLSGSDSGRAVELSFLTHSQEEAEVLKELIQPWCDEENKHRRSDIGSVISEGRYVVYVENYPAKNQPEVHPHYE